MNFLSNRPRKMMATAALSVPLLAAGSTVMFSSAASAATVSPAHVGSVKCTCTESPSTPPSQPTTPPPSMPGGCTCTETPTPPPSSPTPSVVPTTPASSAPPAPAASVTPVATSSPSAGVLPVGGAGTGGGGSTKGGSDAPLAAGGAAAAVAAGGIGFLAYRRFRKAGASA